MVMTETESTLLPARWRLGLPVTVGLAILIPLLIVFRGHPAVPLIAAGSVWVFLTVLFWKSSEPDAREAPVTASTPEVAAAAAQFEAAAHRLRSLARRAPAADAILFDHMAGLTDRLRAHHLAVPSHAARTARFRRHALDRMVGIVADYVDLVHRSGGHQTGSDQGDRLAALSRQLDGFVPILERLDRACLDNDLTTVEIELSALETQLWILTP